SSRRRHTRFSRDWSSDVCSSDLRICTNCIREEDLRHEALLQADSQNATNVLQHLVRYRTFRIICCDAHNRADDADRETIDEFLRSEERRVGKECRSRRWAGPWAS